ncbi:MAG: hypothetical protein LIO54_08340 [Oscillospiraceae bacterium]|nr:hypothetical protein [Oscillospiraceae bacterium]
MERNYYPINEESARLAHEMMSMSDYHAGSKTAGYTEAVNEVYDLADRIAQERPDSADKAYRLANRYSRRMAENMNQNSRIGTMCPSVMISGAGNYPVKKHEKQMAAYDSNMRDYQEIQKIKDQMNAILHGKDVILSNDEKAIEKLENKLESLTELQETMKAANAYYKKNGTVDGCPALTQKQIDQIKHNMTHDFHFENKPFDSYMLTNNGAEIRRIRKRLESLKAIKSRETTEAETKYFRVVENTEAIRLQLFFDGKPEPEVRDILKHYGFKWSPKNECWQRQLNENARFAMKQVIARLDELEAQS